MRLLTAVAIAGLPLALAALAPPTISKAEAADASSNAIIWDSPKAAPAPAPTKAAPDGSGIIWDQPGKAPPAPSGTPPANAAPDSNGIVWNAPPAPNRGTVYTPPMNGVPVPGAKAAPQSAKADTTGTCREFQTTITIDGQKQPAHGTVCRQPDGTWRVVNN